MPLCGPVFCTLGPSTLTESLRLGICAVQIGEITPKRELLSVIDELFPAIVQLADEKGLDLVRFSLWRCCFV